MGQKTSPIGFRTGITLNWQSTWFAPKANYGEFLIEDYKIRDFVDKRYTILRQSIPIILISFHKELMLISHFDLLLSRKVKG